MESDEPRRVRFFEFLSDEEREELAEAAELAAFAPGEVLIEESADAGGLFVLTSGQVEIRKRISGRADRLLAVLDGSSEEAVFGERALLGHEGASATVRARGKVETVKITREKFAFMIAQGRPAAYKLTYRIACILAERMAKTDETIARIAARLEDAGAERDFEVFRDKLLREWAF